MLCFLPPVFVLFCFGYFGQSNTANILAWVSQHTCVSQDIRCGPLEADCCSEHSASPESLAWPRLPQSPAPAKPGVHVLKRFFFLPPTHFLLPFPLPSLLPSPLPCTCSVGSIHTNQDGNPCFATHLWVNWGRCPRGAVVLSPGCEVGR